MPLNHGLGGLALHILVWLCTTTFQYGYHPKNGRWTGVDFLCIYWSCLHDHGICLRSWSLFQDIQNSFRLIKIIKGNFSYHLTRQI